MAKKIELKPLREWQEKDGNKILDSVRLYVGSLHVATVEPSKNEPDMWLCRSMLDGEIIKTEHGALPLEDHKLAIELSLKEFINTVLHNYEK